MMMQIFSGIANVLNNREENMGFDYAEMPNTEKATTHKWCAKCGADSGNKMKYDSIQDNLKITCERCEYTWRKDPLDKKRSDDEV